MRFDVVSGDIAIITSAPGDSETTALTATATSDSTGTARVRIRVSANATAQTALLRITDVSSGFTQTTSVTIAPSTNAALNAQPDTVRFTGPELDDLRQRPQRRTSSSSAACRPTSSRSRRASVSAR